MSIESLFQSNTYDIFANTITANNINIFNGNTNSFRKGKSNLQNIDPSNTLGSTLTFDTFINQPFVYLDNQPNNCYTFIDDSNIRINVSGKYLIFGQINAGSEVVGATMIVGINIAPSIITTSISCVVQSAIMLPFNNGFHSQNLGMTFSAITVLNENDIIQCQYVVSSNTDVYPSSSIGMKYLNS